jgi:predicted phosphohydrolase
MDGDPPPMSSDGAVSFSLKTCGMATTYRPSADDPVLVSEAARLLNKSVATIRKWEARGLLHARRTASGTRVFARGEIEQLRASLDRSESAVTTTPAA